MDVGELAQWLKALVIADDLIPIASTHMASNRGFMTQIPEDLIPSLTFKHTCIHAKHTFGEHICI